MKKSIVSFITVVILASAIAPATPIFAAESETATAATSQSVVHPSDMSFLPGITLSEKTATVQHAITELDPYVRVVENQFVLDIPQNLEVDATALQEARMLIVKTNQVISDNKATIDVATRTATFTSTTHDTASRLRYKNGLSKVTVHWNFVRIYISKSDLIGVQAGLLAGLGVLVGKVPDVRVEFVAAALIGFIGMLTPPGGIWADYNYLLGFSQGSWGWQ
ncbi:hypothetical protein [Lacticaseibacillus yichunensis]|uniref:Uncharacterized protein n=1 Tax=Lacticaseibacillus yichunensis TaxID=2486015 RepID=A0ABW4CTE2_9LACO|nr:hypothetical protein [Lacticaseibacillus yichunensis]